MLISNNQVKNITDDKPVNKVKKPKEETVVNRETTIKIKEEFKFSGKNKTGEIPASQIFDNPFLNTNNPLKTTKAKSLVDQIVELDFDDKASLVKKSGEFSKSLQGMSTDQLVDVADYIRHLMQETMGTDDILGGLQSTVFDAMKDNISRPFNFVLEQAKTTSEMLDL